MLLRYILTLLVVFSNASFAQPGENRVALVLGNSAYKSAPLRNPTNDAKDMAAKLKGMGFTVVGPMSCYLIKKTLCSVVTVAVGR